MGAPGAFPVEEKNKGLQKYVRWSKKIEKEAKKFISSVLNNEPFVGIHLRNGIDFVSTCPKLYRNHKLYRIHKWTSTPQWFKEWKTLSSGKSVLVGVHYICWMRITGG